MSIALSCCYNGNYEGDTSMFGNDIANRMDLIDTDSDADYKTELEKYQNSTRSYARTRKASRPLRRLWRHYKQRMLSEKRQEQLTAFIESLSKNYYFQKFYNLLQLIIWLLLLIVRWILICLILFGNWSYGLWRSKSLMRSTARRLLWTMTLAKCGDIYFFTLILVMTPILVAVSICGFCLSVYCTLREWLSRSGYFIRHRVL